MTKNEFLKVCNKELRDRGFKKYGTRYYRKIGNGVLVTIIYQKSRYGPAYYIHVHIHLGDYTEDSEFPDRYHYHLDFDILRPRKVVYTRLSYLSYDGLVPFGENVVLFFVNEKGGKWYDYDKPVRYTSYIDYELFEKDEVIALLKPFLDDHIMPLCINGISQIKEDMGLYLLSGVRGNPFWLKAMGFNSREEADNYKHTYLQTKDMSRIEYYWPKYKIDEELEKKCYEN